MRLQGKGCGEMEDGVCVGLGDYADYLLETDKEVHREKRITHNTAARYMAKRECLPGQHPLQYSNSGSEEA